MIDFGELLREADDWKPELFEPYREERQERMRRLRFVADFATQLFARFDAESVVRRQRAIARIQENPELGLLITAGYVGPEIPPPDYFEPAFMQRVFNA